MLVTVDYVGGGVAMKSCKSGEYGSFEHLLFLFKCRLDLDVLVKTMLTDVYCRLI